MKKQKLTAFLMVIFTTSFPIEKIRNRIGNIVFTAGHAGPNIRKWVQPANPQSTAQAIIRAYFKQFTQAWHSLLPAKIIAWNNAAKNFKMANSLGTGYFRTGKSLFCGWNLVNAILGGVTQISDFFTLTRGTNVPFTSPTFNGSTGACSITTTVAVDTNSKLVIEASAPLSPGVSADKGKYKIIKVYPGGTAAGILTFTSEYAAVWGAPVSGKKIFVSTRVSNNNIEGNVELNPRIKGSAIVS